MDVWFRFVLAVLATWRVTHLLANEDGPADLIVKFRALLEQSLAGKLMDCFNCLSLWIAAAVALLVTRHFPDWLVLSLALSGAACLLERLGREPIVIEPGAQFSEGDPHHVLRSETSGVTEQFESPHGADPVSNAEPPTNPACPVASYGADLEIPGKHGLTEPSHLPASSTRAQHDADRDILLSG